MREERLEVSVTFEERRDRRRAHAQLSELRSLTNGLPSRTNCTRRKRSAAPKEEVRVWTPSPT
jgi:hypothetical protein